MVARELLPDLERAELRPDTQVFAYYKAIYLANKEETTTDTTMRKYHMICDRLEPFYKRKIGDIKASEIRAYLSSLKLSPKTFRGYLSVINGIFKEAIYDEAITKNPCEAIELPKLKKPDIELFTKSEITSLTSGDSWFDNFIGVAFFTGMRNGEIIALRWGDISFEQRAIRIERNFAEGSLHDCKTDGSRRTIPMFDEAYYFLQRQYLKTGLKNGYVFTNEFNEPYKDVKLLGSIWARHCRERDVIQKRMYNTRHTFTVTLLETGNYSVMDVSRFLGHNSTQMLFSKYAKYIKGEQKKFELNLGFRHNLGTKEKRSS